MDVLDLTRHLVSIDSQNPGVGEARIADVVIDEYAKPAGFDARRVELEPGRPNVFLTVDRGPGPHLALSGHLDTKPVGDARGSWRSDPFELTIDDDLAYGLGATDMKGAVAAMLTTLSWFADNGPSGILTLILTADEEQSARFGSRALVAAGAVPAVDAIVIGEPSGFDQPWEAIFLVSRGFSYFDVELRTRQGHSALSDRLGRNAIQVAADLVGAFERFDPPVATPGPVPCAPTVNAGMAIEGGVCSGTWPGRCRVGFELRLVPGMDRDEVDAAIRGLVASTVGDQAEYDIAYLPGREWVAAAGLAPDAPVVRAAQRACARVLGTELPTRAYPGGTDATQFLSGAGIPTISSLGPGWLTVAHGANECVGVGQLHEAVDLYTTLTREFLAS